VLPQRSFLVSIAGRPLLEVEWELCDGGASADMVLENDRGGMLHTWAAWWLDKDELGGWIKVARAVSREPPAEVWVHPVSLSK
jgi:hypothetical protein